VTFNIRERGNEGREGILNRRQGSEGRGWCYLISRPSCFCLGLFFSVFSVGAGFDLVMFYIRKTKVTKKKIQSKQEVREQRERMVLSY
jgi:hypothetical protein